MSPNETNGFLFIAVYGSLRKYMEKAGHPNTLRRTIPKEGQSPYEIASALSIPAEEIEATFRNGRIINIHDRVFPGDRLALFPYGTPGPYRIFLGMIRENSKRRRSS